MTLAFEFHPEADAEFFAGADWYEDRERGLGRRFLGAVRAAIGAAADDPEAWPSWPGWDRAPIVRSKSVSDLPYRVVYFVVGDQLTIVAVAHAKRRPGYWRDRVSQ